MSYLEDVIHDAANDARTLVSKALWGSMEKRDHEWFQALESLGIDTAPVLARMKSEFPLEKVLDERAKFGS